MRPIFVTGTGTGTGKTLASAVLLRALGNALDLQYVKPVQTGCPPDDDAGTVAALSGHADRVSRDGYRLKDPVSPHLAAEREAVELTVSGLCTVIRKAAGARCPLVEGAGGLLVPLNAHETIADLADALDAVTVVAALGGLGTINHTLLTLAELERRGRPVAGVILFGNVLADNADVIESRGAVPVLARIPDLVERDVTAALTEVAESIDPAAFHSTQGSPR